MTVPKWKVVGYGFHVGSEQSIGEIQIDELGVLLRVHPIGSHVFGRVGGESGIDAANRIAERMNKLETYAANSTEDLRERADSHNESETGWMGQSTDRKGSDWPCSCEDCAAVSAYAASLVTAIAELEREIRRDGEYSRLADHLSAVIRQGESRNPRLGR